MTEDDQVIRPELRLQDVHERGEGYSSARLKAIKQAMQKPHTLVHGPLLADAENLLSLGGLLDLPRNGGQPG